MTPFQFPAGVTNLASRVAKTVNWRECHLIRWDNGVTLRPINGWEKQNFPPPPSRIRKMHRWSTLNNIIYTAYLCENRVYVDIDGVITDITPAGGMNLPVGNSGGYGDYIYGRLTYGTPRPGESRLKLYTPTFSMDNWGEELRVMTSSDGRLLGWSPTAAPGTLLTAVENAPIGNRSFVVTPERHIMLFGSEVFNRFSWCDEEDDTNWNYLDVLSRAGFYDMSPESPIIAHQQFDGGNIMFTPAMSYHIEYVGLPYVYKYRQLGKIPVPISPASICETPDGVVWPSLDGWWIFDGTTPRIIPCPLWDFIEEHLDVVHARFNAACIHLANKGEVWWFFPDIAYESDVDNHRYIIWDYRGKIWSMGKLNRNCGFVYANDRYPLMSDGKNVWKHEIGFTYPDTTELPWIESFNLTPNGGENWLTVNKILPEIIGDSTAFRIAMMKTNDRINDTYVKTTPRSIQTNGTGKGWVDIRETARDMRLRIEMVKNSPWGTVGTILIDSKVRGKKS